MRNYVKKAKGHQTNKLAVTKPNGLVTYLREPT